MQRVLGYLFAAGAITLLVAVLWAILRFSVLSPRRLRNAQLRLRFPKVAELSRWSGIAIPPALEAAYRTDSRIEKSEFALVDPCVVPPKRWEIGHFIPLSVSDAMEWQKISGATGVPIATDLGKGVYILRSSGSIVLVGGSSGAEAIVAGSVAQFLGFTAQEALEA